MFPQTYSDIFVTQTYKDLVSLRYHTYTQIIDNEAFLNLAGSLTILSAQIMLL